MKVFISVVFHLLALVFVVFLTQLGLDGAIDLANQPVTVLFYAGVALGAVSVLAGLFGFSLVAESLFRSINGDK